MATPGGSTLQYTYNGRNLTSFTDAPDGGVTRYTYNEAGQTLSITDALGNVSRFAYEGANLVRSTDANGNETKYAYDSENRLTATTDALGNRTGYTYDCVGNLISETDALGNVTEYSYDLNGSVTDNAGKPTAADVAAHPGEMAYRVDNVKVARLSVMSFYDYALVLAGSGKLSSLWNAVKTTVKEAASNFVDNFRQAPVKTVASTLVSAVKTVVNPVGAIIDAVSTVSNEMKAQNPQPASSAPSNSSGGSSGSFDYSTSIYGSYTANPSGGFIDESGWFFKPKTSDSPTIKLADPETMKKCESGAKGTVVQLRIMIGEVIAEKVEEYFTDSNMYGGIVGGLSIAFSSLFSNIEESISTAVRPANIGAGTFSKQIAQELEEAAKMSGKLSKVLNIAAYGAVAIDVGMGIYNNIQNDSSTEKIIKDALVDTVVTGGTVLAAAEAGAFIGSIVPGAGTVVGAVGGFAVGTFIYIGTDMIRWNNGENTRENIKDWVNENG